MLANPLGVKTFQFPTYCLLWAMPSIALWRPSVKRFNRFKSAQHFRSDLIAKIAIFFESFIDDALFTRPAIPNSE